MKVFLLVPILVNAAPADNAHQGLITYLNDDYDAILNFFNAITVNPTTVASEFIKYLETQNDYLRDLKTAIQRLQVSGRVLTSAAANNLINAQLSITVTLLDVSFDLLTVFE